jgi:hypothetical protein
MSNTTGYPATDEGQRTALNASASSCVSPRTIEFADGTYAGRADPTIDSDGRVRNWAWVPTGLVEIDCNEYGEWMPVTPSKEG